MIYTSEQLIKSLINSVSEINDDYYSEQAKILGVTPWDIETACIDIQLNLEETLKIYPLDNQEFIKENVALAHFVSYIPEHVTANHS